MSTTTLTHLTRFTALFEALQRHPRVKVLSFWTRAPAPSEMRRDLEATLGRALDPALLAFYRETNGLQLRWVLTDHPDFDDRYAHLPLQTTPQDAFEQIQQIQADDDRLTGCINLLPIEDVFDGLGWHNDTEISNDTSVDFDGETIPAGDFQARIFPFDVFSHYHDAALILTRELAPGVIQGSDHQSCYTDWPPRPSPFGDYLEMLLLGKGVVADRFYNWSRSPGQAIDIDALELDDAQLEDPYELSAERSARLGGAP